MLIQRSGLNRAMNQSPTSQAAPLSAKAFAAPIPSFSPWAILLRRSTRNAISRCSLWSSASKKSARSLAHVEWNRPVRRASASGDGFRPCSNQELPNARTGPDDRSAMYVRHTCTTDCSRNPQLLTTSKRPRLVDDRLLVNPPGGPRAHADDRLTATEEVGDRHALPHYRCPHSPVSAAGRGSADAATGRSWQRRATADVMQGRGERATR
jgi:hypothetical protein